MTLRRLLVPIAVLAVLSACGDDDPAGPAIAECAPLLTTFSAVVAGDTTDLGGGLRRVTVEAGTGATAAAGTTLLVHFSGYLEDGTRFGTSCAAVPVRFVVGAGQVIPGFEQGLTGLRVGGVSRLIVPPGLGYGDQPPAGIPADATLIFDVQLVDVSRS